MAAHANCFHCRRALLMHAYAVQNPLFNGLCSLRDLIGGPPLMKKYKNIGRTAMKPGVVKLGAEKACTPGTSPRIFTDS